MVYAQDSTESFTITLTALLEGIGTINSIVVSNLTSAVDYTYTVATANWSPSSPEAVEADSIQVLPEIINNGAVSDTIYGQFASPQVTPTESLIQESLVNVGFTLLPSWSFTMPPNAVNITINAGHVE